MFQARGGDLLQSRDCRAFFVHNGSRLLSPVQPPNSPFVREFRVDKQAFTSPLNQEPFSWVRMNAAHPAFAELCKDEHAFCGRFFGAYFKKFMAEKKSNKAPKAASRPKVDEERKLLEEHPFESMSQIQNRYGKGRRKSGSDGSHQDGRGSNH